MAFLVTHNSFSNSASFAVWVRNQLFSVRQQLEDGVRGLMLDIYPGRESTFRLLILFHRYLFTLIEPNIVQRLLLQKLKQRVF